MFRSRALLPAVLLAAVLAPVSQPATAATVTITAVNIKFLPADVTMNYGDDLQFLNADVAPHNVVSLPARNGATFRSDTIPQGKSTPVKGARTVPPGKYDFYCTLHPTMIGTLTVLSQRGRLLPVPTNGTVAAPTSLTVYKENLYVASLGTGAVHKLPILPGGTLGPAEVYATGFETPLGTVFDTAGNLYVSDSVQGKDRRYGRIRVIPPGGGDAKTKGKLVIGDLPNGRHATNGLAIRGSRLYFANGNSTDDGRSGGPPETPLSGTILSVPLKARNLSGLRPTADLVVEARGLRNPYDLAFRPGTNEIWTATNGPDALEPYGEDLLHRFTVTDPPVNFGFPGCIYGFSPRGPVATQNPRVTTRCTKHKAPEQTLGMHVSADGLAFGPTGGGWRGDLFIAYYGSTDAPPRGHEIVRIPIVNGKAGYPESVYSSPAPLDVAFGPAGLYIADLSTGQIVLLVSVE